MILIIFDDQLKWFLILNTVVLYRHLISCLHEHEIKDSFKVHMLNLKLKRSRVEHEALHCLNVLTWNLCPAYHLGTCRRFLTFFHSMIAQYKNPISLGSSTE